MKSFMKGRTAQARTPRRMARALWALAFAGLAAACSDSTGTQNLATLTASPATATVAVNGTVQLGASGTRTGFDETRIEGETWGKLESPGTLGEAGAWGEVAALVARFLGGEGVGVCYDPAHDRPVGS